MFHSAAVLCGGSTGWLLATLIGATLAEIGPEVVVTARMNEMARAGNGTLGSGRSGDADAWGGALDWTELVAAVLCLLVELAVAFGAGEALDESAPCLGDTWSRTAPRFGRVMDAAMTTAAPTTPAKRTLRMATTTS